MTSEQNEPAVLGPVQRQVRPYCWRAVGGTIWTYKTSDYDTPLYDQAALDAAVAGALKRRREYDDALLAAERERCAKLCEDSAAMLPTDLANAALACRDAIRRA